LVGKIQNDCGKKKKISTADQITSNVGNNKPFRTSSKTPLKKLVDKPTAHGSKKALNPSVTLNNET
jgi:hypothetical protein